MGEILYLLRLLKICVPESLVNLLQLVKNHYTNLIKENNYTKKQRQDEFL